MAFDAQKRIRDNTLELQDFLKDLKQWETRVKEKDKSLKSQVQNAVSDLPPVRGYGGSRSRHDVSHTQSTKAGTKVSQGQVQQNTKPSTAARHTYDYFHDKWDKFDVDAALKQVDENDSPPQEEKKKKKVQEKPTTGPVSGNGLSSVLKSQSLDPFVDATTEKEMGNKFFKEKKFVQAIEHYSRSIALQPSAVSYANRAMAYIKIRRFIEAEADCTEALALDDRYVKAYSRRGTARKELGNFLGAVADSEFALRLEPENKELKEQYTNAKAMCEKMLSKRPEEKKFPIPIQEIRTNSNAKLAGKDISDNLEPHIKAGSPLHARTPSMQDLERQKLAEKDKEAIVAAQAIAASIAAARATTHTTMAVPKTFYEFEATWKSFTSNPAQQAELLKVIKPQTLPQLFKDNLSSKLLGEILRALEHFFPDNASHAIEILENLTMAKRFNITAMCLTNYDKIELRRLWEEVFTGSDVDEDKVKVLSKLRARFQL